MSERILKALMQLFAIVANVGRDDSNTREFVSQFLNEQLNKELVEEYLLVYDRYYNEQNKKREGLKARKRTSLNSVKVLKICSEINKELTQKQKIYVLVQLLEFIYQNNNDTDQALEFVETVADAFNIDRKEYDSARDFVAAEEGEVKRSESVLIINNKEEVDAKHHIQAVGLNGQLRILYTESVNTLFMKYFGTTELQLNGQLIKPYTTYVLNQGSSLRSSKVAPIYYSDIINRFLNDEGVSKTSFIAERITYRFKNGNIGLHPLTIDEESGNLIGIMGASGSGKSTLLNVLNGNYQPATGSVMINGYDIHNQDNKEEIEGVIGYVSQDDLLIEELTVFQNIFYNAKLCFGDLSDAETIRLTFKVLHALGLFESKNLKVGSPLEKTISGGQRKRVNIALELIREPSVLFVDEPTSGLSSRDSENIMDLLKELSLRGKLIFVVIHQPSSDIFKMFDKLIILDTGGYLIYNGNPVDAIVYFKEQMQQANAVESECPTCGNVNPEQIFNIIESKILDEYGNQTDSRRVAPKDWYKKFKENISLKLSKEEGQRNPPLSNLKIPNAWRQFKVFITRDVKSKLTNKQYLLINFLEAPVLAFILSFIIKYSNEESEVGYVFRENENLTAYIFMSVIVALFLGLTVSAEEIIRDRKILKREKFLNLSRGSYLFSKIAIMFAVSAIQLFTFVLVGNSILEIKGMYLEYWLVLFSAACFANMLGLNISASFDSAVTIYILIPFLIIPQLILSGVIVKFEKLNPLITVQKKVPLTGEIMASKWAFEALAVHQYKSNKFNKQFYYIDKDIKQASFKKNFWISELKDRVNFLDHHLDEGGNVRKSSQAQELLYNEISKENERNPEVQLEDEYLKVLKDHEVNEILLDDINDYLRRLNAYYIKEYNFYNDEKDELLVEMNKSDDLREQFIEMKDAYTNESLEDLVTNKNDLEKIVEWKGELIQRADPIFKEPIGFRAHFLAPSKKFFGKYITTFSANLMVLWSFSIVLAVTLHYDALRKAVEGIAAIFKNKKFNAS